MPHVDGHLVHHDNLPNSDNQQASFASVPNSLSPETETLAHNINSPVKKPYHLPVKPKGTYKHPVDLTYDPPAPVPKLRELPSPINAPINFVTPIPKLKIPSNNDIELDAFTII